MISRQTAEHFTWRDSCDGWYLVNQPERLTVLQECMPLGSSEVRHLHRRAYQFFFIPAGTATLEINGQHVQLHASEGYEDTRTARSSVCGQIALRLKP